MKFQLECNKCKSEFTYELPEGSTWSWHSDTGHFIVEDRFKYIERIECEACADRSFIVLSAKPLTLVV